MVIMESEPSAGLGVSIFTKEKSYFSFSEGIWESFLFLLSGCLQNAEGEMASVVNDESLCVTQGRY